MIRKNAYAFLLFFIAAGLLVSLYALTMVLRSRKRKFGTVSLESLSSPRAGSLHGTGTFFWAHRSCRSTYCRIPPWR